MTWTHKLPTVTGYYWYKDRDTDERGIALVDAVYREAKILVWSETLDDNMYVSDAYWGPTEVTNANWEWYGPIHAPK